MGSEDEHAAGSPGDRSSHPPSGHQKLRVLCLSADQPEFQPLAVGLEQRGCLESRFLWVSVGIDGISALREETFDSVLIAAGRPAEVPPALEFLAALRAGGHDDPVVLLARDLTGEAWAETCRLHAEALVTGDFWHSPALAPMLERALRRAELCRENYRLSLAHHRRLVRERHEAEHLLTQQQQLIRAIEGIAPFDHVAEPCSPSCTAESCRHAGLLQACSECRTGQRSPVEFDADYQELLRTCVIMGSGSLGAEIQRLAECMARGGIGPREALQLHLDQVEALIRGRGSRSARHVMARADLLALELMIQLGECYRQSASTGTTSNSSGNQPRAAA